MAEADWTYLNDGLDIRDGGSRCHGGHRAPTGRWIVPLCVQLARRCRGCGGPVRQPRELCADGQGRLDSRRRAARSWWGAHGILAVPVPLLPGQLGQRQRVPARPLRRRSATASCSARARSRWGSPRRTGLACSSSRRRASRRRRGCTCGLDVIVNTNGDVVLKVFQSDLALHTLGAPPDWQPVSGMVEFIDDHLASTPARSRSPRGAAASASP